MDFTDFTRKLAYGQLKNTAAIDDADLGILNSGHEDQILDLTNQGLIDITTRMKLLESTTVLTFTTGQNIYNIVTGLSEQHPNYVRLLSVHGVPAGYDVVPENERVFIPKSNNQITMPSWDTVRFTDKFMIEYGPAVDLKYQMKHPLIDATGTMNLPPHLYEALVLYVAGLYLSHMGGEQHTAKGDSYYGLYLRMMGEDVTENKSQTSEVVDEDTRFQDRGFV